MQEVLHEKYYIHTSSEVEKAGPCVGKVHSHDKTLLPPLKPEKAVKILS